MVNALIELLTPTYRTNYRGRILGAAAANLVAYYPMHDCIPGGACTDVSGNAFHGTYGSAVSRIGDGMDGMSAVRCIGAANSWVELYSAGLSAAFSTTEGTLLAWGRLDRGAKWNNGAYGHLCVAQYDSSNFTYLRKSNVGSNPQVIELSFSGAGTHKLLQSTTVLTREPSDLGWVCWAITWSSAGNAVRHYFDGRAVKASDTYPAWNPANAVAVFRAGASGTPDGYWTGDIAHVAVWTTPLTATQIQDLSK